MITVDILILTFFLVIFRLSQLEPAEKWLHDIYSKHLNTNLDSKDCNCKSEGKSHILISKNTLLCLIF